MTSYYICATIDIWKLKNVADVKKPRHLTNFIKTIHQHKKMELIITVNIAELAQPLNLIEMAIESLALCLTVQINIMPKICAESIMPE